MLTARPLLATYAQTLTRSILLSLGLDHALIDFFTHVALGAVTVLLTILFTLQTHPRRSYDGRPSGGP